MIAGPVQLRWDPPRQRVAFLRGLRFLNSTAELTLEVLLGLHTILLPPSHPQRGRFRDQPIEVRFNGITQWRPPPPDEAERRAFGTLERINLARDSHQSRQQVRASAARTWFEITDVHPFFDGNGRVARSLAAWILINGGFALLMDPGIYCHEREAAYYRALDSNNLNPRLWTDFFDQLVRYCFCQTEFA